MADKFKWGKLIGKGKGKDNTINMMAPLEPDPQMAPVVDLSDKPTQQPRASQPPVAPPAQQVNETSKEERAPLVIEWNTYQEEQRLATGTDGQLVTSGSSNHQSQVQNFGGTSAPLAPPISQPNSAPVSHNPIAYAPTMTSETSEPTQPPTSGFSWDSVLNPTTPKEEVSQSEPEIPAEHAPDNGMGPITRGWDDVELTPSEKNSLESTFRGQETGPISMDSAKDATAESIANNPAWDEPTFSTPPPVNATPPVEVNSQEDAINQIVDSATQQSSLTSAFEPVLPPVSDELVAQEPEPPSEPVFSAPPLEEMAPISVPETNFELATEEPTIPPINVSPEAAQAPAWNTSSATAGSFGLQNPFEPKQEQPNAFDDSEPQAETHEVESADTPDFESDDEFDWSALEAFAKQKAEEDKMFARPANLAPETEAVQVPIETVAEIEPLVIEESPVFAEDSAPVNVEPTEDQPQSEFSWSKIMGIPAPEPQNEAMETPSPIEEPVLDAELAHEMQSNVEDISPIEEISVAEFAEPPITGDTLEESETIQQPVGADTVQTPINWDAQDDVAGDTEIAANEEIPPVGADTVQTPINWDAQDEAAPSIEIVTEEATPPIDDVSDQEENLTVEPTPAHAELGGSEESVVAPPAPPVQEQSVANARADIPEQYKRILDESEFEAAKDVRVGDLLLQNGLITQTQLDRALERQNESREKIGQVLISMNIMSEERLLQAIAAQKGVNPWLLQHDAPSLDAVKMLPEGTCRMFQALPVAIRDNHLVVAMRNPSDEEAKHSLAAVAKMEIEVVLADDARLAYAIDKSFGLNEAKRIAEADEHVAMAMKAYQSLADGQLGVQIPANEESVRVVYGLVDSIIQDGISMHASDIHFEPTKDTTLIRYRLDGRLKTVREIPRDLTHLVEYRLKSLAEINANESRIAQEGRYSASYGPNQVEVLVNAMPSTHGCRFTLQILDRTTGLKKLKDLGMNAKNERLFCDLINKPYGLFLIAGPSSSGKTTTAYAALNELQSEDRNIITCENPVEYDLRGITQTQVNQKVGNSYSDQVRSALKQDPDVIFIGEIADRQTADIAIRASMTGHFVIATVPGNDAASSISNLLDLGVDPHLLSSVVVGTMSQRLLRKLNPAQRESTKPSDEERFVLYRFFKEDEVEEVYQPSGENSWMGRVAIHEVLPVTNSVKKLIACKATSTEIREAAAEAGFVPMQKLAMDKVKSGETTVSEAIHQLAFEITEPYGEFQASV